MKWELRIIAAHLPMRFALDSRTYSAHVREILP